MSDQWVMYLLVAIMLGFSLYNAWKTIRLYQRKTASATWSVTAGEVLSKYVSTHTNNKGGKSYQAVISYMYTAFGDEFERKITRGSLWGRKGAEKILAGIADTIEVRYNPQKPEEHITAQDTIGAADVFFIVMPLVFALILLFVT